MTPAEKVARTAANRNRRIAKDEARKSWCAKARRNGWTHSISKGVRTLRRAAR